MSPNGLLVDSLSRVMVLLVSITAACMAEGRYCQSANAVCRLSVRCGDCVQAMRVKREAFELRTAVRLSVDRHIKF